MFGMLPTKNTRSPFELIEDEYKRLQGKHSSMILSVTHAWTHIRSNSETLSLLRQASRSKKETSEKESIIRLYYMIEIGGSLWKSLDEIPQDKEYRKKIDELAFEVYQRLIKSGPLK